MNTSKKTKRIFISDLHMGDGRSQKGVPPKYPHPYGWLRDDKEKKRLRLTMLADFLDYLMANPGEYNELIIIGDLLDHWVCPMGLNPTTFEEIIDTPQNKAVIANLKKMASSKVDIDVYYVPGNHDMLLPQTFIEDNFPGIQFIGKDNIGVFKTKDGLAAEHGSQYTLFCAPNPGSAQGDRLPLGFYISRAAAEKNAVEGKSVEGFDVLMKFIFDIFKDLLKGSEAAMKELYEAIAQDCGAKPNTPIYMNGLEGIKDSITVQEVADKYAGLMKKWESIKPNGVSSLRGIYNEISELHGVAKRQYFEKDKAKIVVFGHTHKYTMESYNRVGDILYEDLFDECCDYIYANSGTWINTHKYCTYVETELDPGKGRHYVRICRYDSRDDPYHVMSEKYIKL